MGLADPKVIHAIRATLHARGMARGELDDGVADVQVKALELLVTRDAPRDLEEWKKLCNKIAVDCAIDALRKKARRARYEDDLCEDPDAHAADLHREKERDPVDMERLLAIIEEQLRAARIPEISFTILDGEAVGASHAEIAAELRITRDNVRAILLRMRKEFRERNTSRGVGELLPRTLHLARRPKRTPH
jgi:DNA-directed RNA polymerase specialized sigma24 family protein